MQQEQIKEVLSRLPESTKEYVATLLVCPSHRVDKNAKLARNVIIAYGNCVPEDAARVCKTLVQLAEGCSRQELRDKWEAAFHDVNTRPLGMRSHATGYRLL